MAFPLLALLPAVEKLLDTILPNPEAKAAAILELRKEENAQALEQMQIELQTNKMQADINLEEAKHSNLFVSGARPFIMWICGVAFGYHFIIQPLLAFIMAANGNKVDLPEFDMNALNTVLLGMLGLGGMRSFDKMKGTSK